MITEKHERRGRPLKYLALPKEEFTINSLFEKNNGLCKGALQYRVNQLVSQDKISIIGKISSNGRPLKVYKINEKT